MIYSRINIMFSFLECNRVYHMTGIHSLACPVASAAGVLNLIVHFLPGVFLQPVG